ncbi:MAG: carbamate kinase [Bacilli bacterium]
MSRIVVALGGNALGNSAKEQLELVGATAKPLVDLVEAGHELIVAHGNGPQVGMINLAMDYSTSDHGTPEMPFPECGAMSQGYIGFHLQNAIQTELKNRNISNGCASIVTQVVVDKNDPAFKNPTKPVGAFYDEETAKKLADEKGFSIKEDSGRGYRRVVPSPKPIDIVEKNVIKSIIDTGNIVITCGGGGVPVYKDGNSYYGVPAVIDKDFASELAAEIFDADYLFILTAVDRVSINFGKPDQIDLETITVKEAKEFCEAGHFAPGSMLPKVEACMKFANSKIDRVAVIASLENAAKALKGESGTKIVK